VFTDALKSARVRPVHPAYPQISQALGEAIVSERDRALPRLSEQSDLFEYTEPDAL